jgi:nucleoside-diphosphate-sugar epimerase
MSKHLVLGSEGQIGKYVVQQILDQGDQVVAWDIVNGIDYDLADAFNSTSLVEAMREVDFVHFLAFNVGGAKYLAEKQSSYAYIKENIDIMLNVFDALEVTKKPFYFASSQMQNMTESSYGTLKNLGEFYTNSLGGVNVRFWNIYGYETDLDKSHVITDFIRSALDTGKILCRTDGTEKRIFMHAEDAAAALCSIFNPIDSKYEKYAKEDYLELHGSGQFVDIKTIARLIAEQIPGTEIYFSVREDKSQTKLNLPNHFAYKSSLNHYNSWSLINGLKDMINRIKDA